MKKLNSTEINAQLNDVNSQIDEVNTQINWLEVSSAPKTDVLQQFTDVIDAEEQNFNDKFSVSTYQNEMFQVSTRPAEYRSQVDMGSLLCGLFAPEIKASIKNKIDALDYEAGPLMSERPALLKNLKAQKLLLQSTQNKLIEAANKIGLTPPIPQGFSPEILLGFTD